MRHNLTKQQNMGLKKIKKEASWNALRRFFAGADSAPRVFQFLVDTLITAATWLMKLFMLGSWAAVLYVLIGSNHNDLFKQLYTWVASTPYVDVVTYCETLFWVIFWQALVLATAIALWLRVADITQPASRKAEQRFHQNLDQSSQ